MLFLRVKNTPAPGLSGLFHAPSAPEGSIIHLKIADEPERRPSRSSEEELPLTTETLAQSPEGIEVFGAIFSYDPRENKLRVSAQKAPVIFEAPNYPGFRGKVPRGQCVELTIDSEKSSLDIQTPPESKEPVVLKFFDEGGAEIGANSQCSYEVFSDGSYLFRGQGEHVMASWKPDGRKVPLSEMLPPLSGGPLKTRIGDDGNARFIRRTPTTPVRIHPYDEDCLLIEVGHKLYRIVGKDTTVIALENGAYCEISSSPNTHTVGWHVRKGEFRFSIVGIYGWQAIALTGNSALVQLPDSTTTVASWDEEENQIIDLRNHSAAQNFLLRLPSGFFASLPPGGGFQYAYLGGENFAASSRNAPATLFNPKTRRETPLKPASRIVEPLLPIRPQGPSAIRRTCEVGLNWEKPGVVNVGVSGTTVRVDSSRKRTLVIDQHAKLDVRHGKEGEVILKAGQGDFMISASCFQTWNIRLPENQEILLRRDPDHSIFSAEAAATNNVIAVVHSDGGLYSMLSPGTIVNFVTGTDERWLESSFEALNQYETPSAEPHWFRPPSTSQRLAPDSLSRAMPNGHPHDHFLPKRTNQPPLA